MRQLHLMTEDELNVLFGMIDEVIPLHEGKGKIIIFIKILSDSFLFVSECLYPTEIFEYRGLLYTGPYSD